MEFQAPGGGEIYLGGIHGGKKDWLGGLRPSVAFNYGQIPALKISVVHFPVLQKCAFSPRNGELTVKERNINPKFLCFFPEGHPSWALHLGGFHLGSKIRTPWGVNLGGVYVWGV